MSNNLKEHASIQTKYIHTVVEVWTNGADAFVEISSSDRADLAKLDRQQATQLRDALNRAIASLD